MNRNNHCHMRCLAHVILDYSVVSHLVSSTDEVHVVPIVEPGDNIRPESKGHTPVVLTPPSDIFVRVGPEEITQETWHKQESRREQ